MWLALSNAFCRLCCFAVFGLGAAKLDLSPDLGYAASRENAFCAEQSAQGSPWKPRAGWHKRVR